MFSKLLKLCIAALLALGGTAVIFVVWAGVRISQHARSPIERLYAGRSTRQRRPIVLVHGVNRTGRIWTVADDGHGNLIPGATSMADSLRANGYPNLYLNTFAETRNASFLENAKALKGWIARVKKRYRAKNVDLITHSMGALVARAYLQEMDQRDGKPAEAIRYGGDVRRLIMIAAPHLGSPFGDTVASIFDWYASRTLKDGGGPDLKHLNARVLPCKVEYHSILVSTARGERGRRWSFWRLLRALLAYNPPRDGDGVLSLRSQNLAEAISPDACPRPRHHAHLVRTEPGFGHRDAALSPAVQRAVLSILNGQGEEKPRVK